MYTTIIHPLRKALDLSVREYVLLDAIYVLSHNQKYGGWCVAPKSYIAGSLGLSQRWVYNGIKKLEKAELIEKDSATGYLKTTDLWNEIIANKNDWLIGFNGKESQFVSAKAVQSKLKPETAKNAGTLQNQQNTLQELQSDTAESAYHNNKDNNKDNNKKENIKRKKFQKPSIQEISEYCKERNNGVEPNRFFDHYESKGWLIGRAPMKNWKAAVRTWERKKKFTSDYYQN